ncbi:zinc finger protein OZF-like [Corythoichthys intestinalis]|uniref:zinc finger protein OZF-like n=1 Tax=Corythoichthys intestinalis TaxID=161448 RepID=UPI0025A58DCF|nr:zinc finger protein OZF-like [Corythoichthys intestinalis]
MFEKSVKEEDYAEEMHRSKEKDQRGVDAVCKKLQHKADIGPEQTGIKQEEEPESSYIKEEEEEDEITKFPLTSVKSEQDKVPREASEGAEPSSSSSPQQLTTKDVTGEDLGPEQYEPNIKEEEEEDEITQFPLKLSVKREQDDGPVETSGGGQASSSRQHLPNEDEGEQCEGSQADSLSAPLSNSDDGTSYSSDYDDEDSSDDMEFHPHKKRAKCSSKSSLKRETTKHMSGKSFACLFCKKIFPSKSRLTKHTRVHTGEKPFSCSICGKTFAQKENLKKHTRTHTGEKPFACSVCGQRFAQKENLTSHARTHTGEKPFACSFCGQRFAQKGNLTTHTRTHTGEKPFVCSACGKRFSKKTHLTEHTRTHARSSSISLIS